MSDREELIEIIKRTHAGWVCAVQEVGTERAALGDVVADAILEWLIRHDAEVAGAGWRRGIDEANDDLGSSFFLDNPYTGEEAAI